MYERVFQVSIHFRDGHREVQTFQERAKLRAKLRSSLDIERLVRESGLPISEIHTQIVVDRQLEYES